MPEIVTPKPTKGSGILRFSEDIYLELKYDLSIKDPAEGSAALFMQAIGKFLLFLNIYRIERRH